jgi:type IX secretion system PorP/SprF family membrane protein
MIRPYLICVCQLIIYSTINLYGQDIHFSNYNQAPLSYNPANTGNYSGTWRLMGNYRQQGQNLSNYYNSATFAFDHPIFIHSEKGSIGIIYFYDNSANNTLLVNKLYLSGSYFIKISSKSYLHMGLQGGVVCKKLSIDGLSLPDQFDMGQGYFNPDLPSMERFEEQKLSYIDLNWGIMWSRKSSLLSSELGIAMFHYNRPRESFFGNNYYLNPKYLIHGMAKKKILSNLYIRPMAIYTFEAKSNELLFGFDMGIVQKNEEKAKDFYIGTYYRGGYTRNSDALIFKTGFKYQEYEFSIAYDMDISGQKLQNYSANAFEISLIFTRPETIIHEKTIPCEIF